MIEDINERMAQFAPSQNNPLDVDPVARKIAMERQTTQPQETEVVEVDDVARRIAQNRRDLMMATLGSAAEANPDQAAQAKKLGEQFGVGADIAGRNMQQLKKQALLDEIERRDLMRRDPILSRYLSNHEFASMAHDDIDNLAKTEDLFQGSWFARYEDPIAYGKKTISMIEERFRRGRAIVEMGRANDLLGLRAQWSPDPRKASEINEELKKLTTEGGIVGAGVEVVGQMLEGIPEVAETAAMGATAGGAVGAVGGPAGFLTIPAGMLTGAGAGFAAGSARSAFMAESGNSYQQMIEQGYDPEVARKAAIGVGVVNASIEMISFGALAPVLRRLGVNVFRPAVANALAKPTAAKALATLGSDYGKAVAAGASEEFLQEIATGIGDDIARVYGSSSPSRLLDEGGITDLLGTALESGVQGAMGMAILGGIGPVANFRYDMRRAGAAERQQAFFDRLSTNAADSKLRGRDMNAFERFVASQAEGTEAETIFVDAAAMQGVLRQSNLSDEQIDEALPGVREQIQRMAETGGDVTLPTASFAARVAGTDLGTSMLPFVRLAPDAMSLTEAQEFQKNRDSLVEQARVIMEEKGRADDAFVQEARAIEDRIYQEVVATGTMDEQAARANATFVRDLYVTQAARMNTTPAALEQRFPYRVEGQAAAVAEPLEQAATVDASGVATPQYRRAWHKATTGQPITVTTWRSPGGTTAAQLTDFARERMARDTTLGGGWYGARDRDIAEIYGTPEQFEVTLQNPFVFSEPDKNFVLKLTNEELQRIRDAGYDGIIVKGVNATLQGQDRSHLQVVAFNPEQAVRQVPTANIMQQAAKDAAVSQLAMTAQRGRRTTSGDVVITPEEEQILENFIDIEIERQIEKERKKFAKNDANVSKTPEELDKALNAHDTKLRKQLKKKFMATAAEDRAAVRDTLIRHKSAHPVEQGWAFLELGRVAWIDKGDGKGKWENQYKIIPYAFERDEDGNTLVPQTKEYDDRVNALASRMTDEVLAVHTRAMAGDDNAAKIIRQARWYYAMRTRLRQEFGGLGDLFADLLGATSPNTPVRDNWYNAVDALRRAMRGDWDELLPKWIEWVEKIEELEVAMRAYLDNGIAANRPVAAIQRDAEYKELETALKNAREFPEELYPRKENEAKYGFNGKNIVRAMVDLWRTIRDEDVQIGRGATAPKALNFSGNLIGFRQRATIDVWAARELQRLAGLARIPSMAEAGVGGSMLSTGATTGQFGFGQDVFAEAVKKIRSHPVLSKVPELAQINDDDLQALVWFVEKELWTINDWTSTAGEGGSFELEASLTGTNRQEWVKGLRRILDAAPPRALVDTAAKKPAAAAARKAWEPQREILANKLEELEATRKRAMEAKRSPKKANPADLLTKEQIEDIDADIKATKASLKATRPLDTALNQATTAEVRLEMFNLRKRKAAVLLTKLERTVDRFTGGLSEQQSLDTQGVEYIPTDADMAMLSEAMRTALYETDNGATVLASKVLSTQGRYGSIERSIDLEAVVRKGYDIRPLWRTMLKRAKAARQDSTFLSRILRVGEAVDPLYHRPGVEIYFRTSIEPSKLQDIIDKLKTKNVNMFTVIVDGRRLPGTMAGAMGNAVGVRFQYIPEFDQRYGDDLTKLSDEELRETVSQKAQEMQRIAASVLADIPEVSSALQLWHETRVAFASQYDEEIRNAESVAVGVSEGVGAPARAGVWRGQSIRDGIEGADRHVREAAQRKPDGADGQAVAGIQQPGVLEQAAPGPARGGFDPSRLTTILNKNADLSTFIHETAHFYLTILGNLAADPAATPEMRADMDTLLKWFGIAGDTDAARLAAWNALSVDQQRKYHEQFAYNFEVYMFEGKSPSAEMQGLFERFSGWLRRVYRSIRDDLNAVYRREFGEDLPLLTGEVRQVMDRMLASEEQIKRQAAINEMKPRFQSQEESGMEDAEWAAYKAMEQEAIEAAVTDMTKASLRQMQWLSNARSRILREMQAKHAKQRKEIREEVAEEIGRQPLYRAMEYLRTGTFTDADGESVKMEGAHRLDMESVRQMYAQEPENLRPDIAKLGTGGRGMMGMNGIDPDVAAELFGFSSGDELIRALIEAQPMKEAIDARTDEVMLERFSDMSTPEGREAKVQEALHNEARARFVAVELRFVAKATQPVRVLMEAARQAAREMIAGKRIADLRPSEFIAAESRAARAAGKIGKPVNVDAVAQAAYTRAKNEALASGAPADVAEAGAVVARDAARAAAQERLDEQRAQYGADPAQALIRAKRAQLYQNQLAAEALAARDEVEKGVQYLRRVLRDTNVKRMGADVSDQVAQILERFNLRPMSAKRMAERQSLVQWLESLKESGLEPDLAPEILNEAERKPYRELTVAEFRDLVDAVKQLEYIGKNAQKIKRGQEMAEFEEVRDEIVASVRGNFTGKETKPRSPTTEIGKRIAKTKRFLYSHLKAAIIALIMDGGKDDGPVWNFLIRTANEAGNMETRMRAEATKRLTEILAPVFALGKMGGKGIYFDTVGMSLNRAARLVIALNMGNDGNRQRLLDGEGWTFEQVQPILESLTEAEWKAVQDVWDYMESFRPLVGAKERRLYGREPKWVTPVPFTTRTADGKEVRLSGGYYPIKYDPIATERSETIDEAEKARTELRGAYTAATTRRSFTKERAAKVEDSPLLYTMTGVYSGINDVIHDLAWHEWLIQANRLMRDKMFDRAVRETYGAEFKSQLKDWIKDVAAGERGAEDAADMFASYIRRSVSEAGLGFNILSAILQVTGFTQSIVRVGAKHVARGVAAMAASPLQTMKFVNEKSSFMQERARTQFRELNELRNMVGDETAARRRLRLGTYFLMMRMQRMVDVPTWVGAYEKALEAGKDDATAVALADQAVIDSQGSGMLKDLSKIERGGALSKLFTVFYSYMNTVYNMAALSTMTPRSKGRLAADYAMLFIVPVVLNYALKKALTPDVDDEEPDMEKIAADLVAEELSFLMGTMVGVREFQNAANAVVGKETAARGYEGPAGLRAIGEAGRFAVQAKQLEFDRAFRRSAINMLGIGLGLPSAQINRTIDGVEALAEGETENPFAVLTGVQR